MVEEVERVQGSIKRLKCSKCSKGLKGIVGIIGNLGRMHTGVFNLVVFTAHPVSQSGKSDMTSSFKSMTS